jgi:DGQHR domain-containing protein
MAYVFPAIRATQRGRTFYLSTMTYGEVAKLVDLPDDKVNDRLLDDTTDMQRKLNWSRVKGEMKDYLLKNENAFYSALTLFVVPLDLTTELEEGKDFVFDADPGDPSRGTLKVFGTAVFFPGDGQHRTASIREGVKEQHALATTNIPVVLLPYRNKDDVRQLFSDLNLHAKGISKTIGLAFETRDPIAVLAKRIAQDVALFKDRINMKTNSLPASSPYVITMNTLYEATKWILAALHKCEVKEVGEKLSQIASHAPSDPLVGEQAEGVVEVWDVIIGALPAWDKVLAGSIKPAELRDEFVFAHGLGWQGIAQATSVILRTEPEGWDQTVTETLKKIDWKRMVKKDPNDEGNPNPIWQGVAMVGQRVNNTGSGIRAVAGYILEQADISNDDARPFLEALASSRTN